MIKETFKKIYSKNYLILITLLALPLIWKILSISYLFDIKNGLQILSQIALLNIIFKCFEETFFNPLFKIIGKNNIDSKENRNISSLKILILVSFLLVLFNTLIIFTIKPIMKISFVPEQIFNETKNFLILYSIACSLKIISKYLYTISLINNDTKQLFIYLIINTILTSLLLTIFVPTFALNLGVMGIAVTEIVVSLTSIIYLISKYKICNFNNNLKFNYREYFKLCLLAFIETMMRNLIYYFVILVMLNKLNNQDLYYVANEFIWSIMLIPALAQSSLIKQDISNNEKFSIKPYFINTIFLILFMLLLIPISILIFKYIYKLPNYMEYFYTLLKLFPCYIIFIFDSVIEAYFLTIGKLKYILFEGIITNIGVYLLSYILYLFNVWSISLNSIILIFNLGVIISSLYTIIIYFITTKKPKPLIY